MVLTYKKVQDLKLKNFFNMYKYRIAEQDDKARTIPRKTY